MASRAVGSGLVGEEAALTGEVGGEKALRLDRCDFSDDGESEWEPREAAELAGVFRGRSSRWRSSRVSLPKSSSGVSSSSASGSASASASGISLSENRVRGTTNFSTSAQVW